MGVWKHLYLLPLSVFVTLVIAFFTAYGVAVHLGHVKPNFPYISDGGACPPESCIFGQLLNISAVLLGLTVHVRYGLVEDYYSADRERARWEVWFNRIGWLCGMAGALGISIVGNFQEINVLSMHLLGAMLAFFLGVIYCWLQVPITYRTRPDLTRPWLAILRLAIAAVCTVMFISVWVCTTAIPSDFSKSLQDSIHSCNASAIPDDVWVTSSKGWKLHVASTASEWTMALLFSLFLLTFVYEFRIVSVEKAKVHCGVPKPGAEGGARRAPVA